VAEAPGARLRRPGAAEGDDQTGQRRRAKRTGAASPLAGKSRAAVRRAVETSLAATGLGTVGGRSADEIVSRFMDKAAIAEGIGVKAARTLHAFLAIGGTPTAAAKALRALARKEKLAIEKAIDRFEKRNEAFAGHGIDLDTLAFAADFGRRLDYYTGFVFEFHKGKPAGEPAIGGGRYDHLMAEIGAGGAIPAVGFAIWLDRIAGGAT
jgi:ATP phosphoribosyltransferase regulatory subunit